ncbi:MAG TPA: MarR family winged helix-turn-helix transcriptional regulator [Steroidobacteraceae bacterium]|jgi:MarR family transcriptional regulator, transcriptional regulator for hemolysin|nr:MarR family winged helix-turn-helix transcriptional regulator [Steroidobacteraceae bacterium]
MDLNRQLGFLLKDTSRRYSRRFEERAQALSLTLVQCRALLYLENNQGVSQKRLSELTELDPMTLVRILDRMEADGWVQRRFDPADRRAHTLWLTPKAKPVLDHIAQLIADTRTEALQGLSNEERSKLLELLERLHGNLSSLPPIAAERSPPARSSR